MKTSIKQVILWMLVLAIVVGISGCREKVDLSTIDTRMKAEMGVALPVGKILFTANDLLGGGKVKKVAIDKEGVFHLVDTLTLQATTFPKPDVSTYISTMTDQFKLKHQLDLLGVLDENGNLIEEAKGLDITIGFDKAIQLKDVNKDPNQSRLDKAEVKAARFTSVISPTNLDLDWDWIEKVVITFNHQFTIAGGNSVVVYKKGGQGGYNTSLPVDITNFVLNLMKDIQQQPGWNNVVDTIGMKFSFTFKVPKGSPFTVSSTSAFNYVFSTKSIDYSAIYGWFRSSQPIHNRYSINLDSLLGAGVKDLTTLLVKLKEPAIHLAVAHHMSVPVVFTIDTLNVTDGTETKWATWNSSTSHSFDLKDVISPSSNPSDSAWNEIKMNQHVDSGHLDNLFTIRPNRLTLGYTIGLDGKTEHYSYAQHRITDHLTVATKAGVDIPFKLDKASEVAFATQLSNIRFDKLSLDSLLKDVKVVEKSQAKTLKLAMQFTNSMPFKVNAKVWFLRQDSSVLDLKIVSGQDLNQITLPAPKMAEGTPYGRVIEPSVSTVIIDMNQQQLDSLVKARHLKVDAYVGSNPEPCMIDTTTSFTVGVSIGASVEAIINPKKK